MKTYKVTFNQVHQVVYRGSVTVSAQDEKEARELADAVSMEGDISFSETPAFEEIVEEYIDEIKEISTHENNN